jgi:hypothetical protein
VSVDPLGDAVAARLDAFDRSGLVQRIWDRDRSVWSDDPNAQEIVDRLGWLDLPTSMARHMPVLQSLADDVAASFERVVLLGMGGSSLAPEVLVQSIGRHGGAPVFRMLDSTHPSAVADIERTGDLARTLFVVASKSGTTLETMSFFRYFWDRVVTRITEIDRRQLQNYPGTYSNCREVREKAIAELRARARHQQEEMERIQRFIDRFRAKASKAKNHQCQGGRLRDNCLRNGR